MSILTTLDNNKLISSTANKLRDLVDSKFKFFLHYNTTTVPCMFITNNMCAFNNKTKYA